MVSSGSDLITHGVAGYFALSGLEHQRADRGRFLLLDGVAFT
jgi:hypothetical protein